MSHRINTKLQKYTGLLRGAFVSIKNGIDPKLKVPTVTVESKTFDIGDESNFKLYLLGRLEFNGGSLEKYGTYVVLTQKKLDIDKEKVIHSFHFDGNINEAQSDHPIFHMQFDNSLIEKIEPTKYSQNRFEVDKGENRRIRIPTPQLDIITFIYYFLKSIDTKNLSKVRVNYLDYIAKDFNISSILCSYECDVSKVIFPS